MLIEEGVVAQGLDLGEVLLEFVMEVKRIVEGLC